MKKATTWCCVRIARKTLMSAGKRCGKSTIVLKGYGNMQVYVVTEYGGSYDDAWNKIIGIYTDKAKAEEIKDTYWGKILKRQKEVNEEVTKYDGVDVKDDDSPYWALINNQYDMDDIAGVKIDEYPLDEFLGGYYNPENAL